MLMFSYSTVYHAYVVFATVLSNLHNHIMTDAPGARCTYHQIVMMIKRGVGEVATW
jgi:hypothetical protein